MSRPSASVGFSPSRWNGARKIPNFIPLWAMNPRLLVDQPVELAGVLAGDLGDDVRGQMAELLGDVLRRLRPDTVGMRVVGAPHERLDADVVDELGADRIELERRLALTAPVFAGPHLQSEVAEAVLPLEVHPVERVRDPADTALAERDADVRVALEDAGTDDGGQDVDEVHLEAGHAGEECGTPGQPGLAVPYALRQRRERVEVEREIHVVHRAPQRLPHRMPHGLHLPRARELEPAQPTLGDAVRLGHGRVDVAVGQAREPDLTVGMMAAEVHEPVVVDPEHLRSRLVVGEPRGRAEDAEHDLGVHAVTLHVGDPELGIGRAPNALAAVGEEAGGRHDVHALVLPGHVLLPGRAEATDEAEAGALLRGPVRPVGAFDHVRHPVLHRGRGVRREQVGGQPGKIDVAIGGDPTVAHRPLPRQRRGARRTRPGSAPVCSPWSITISPPTITWCTPSARWTRRGDPFGPSRVISSSFTPMRARSKTMRSATIPSRTRPRSGRPMMLAGWKVKRRMASSSFRSWRSRTHSPST